MGASSPQDSWEEKENIFIDYGYTVRKVRAEVCGPEPLKALKYKLLKNISRLEK